MSDFKATILCVDHYPGSAEGLADILELEGYKPLIAHDGLEALQIVRQQHPDLILSEINLPRLNGFLFLKEVRNDLSIATTPFIFWSVRSLRSDVRRALYLGADEFVEKPCDIDGLIITIMMVLKKSELLKPVVEVEKDNDVFFSYRLYGVKIMQQSIDHLSKVGLSVTRPNRHQPHEAEFEELTINQIKRSRCVVALISEGPTRFNIRKFWSDYELAVAQIVGIRIFPALIDGQGHQMPDTLKNLAFMDARQDTDVVLKKLADHVHKYIRSI